MLISLRGLQHHPQNGETSMSTSLLYHAFGIRGYQYQATKFHSGGMTIRVAQAREKLCCPACGSSKVRIVEWFERRWRTVPIGSRETWIEMSVPKVECQKCFSRRRVTVSFAEPHKQHTRAFERYVVELLRFMTPQDVSRHLGISWDLANDIQKRRLKRKFGRPKLKHLKRLAVDEVYVGKRHKYLTLVLDLDSGAVVFVGEGRGSATLRPFFRRLRQSRAKVRAVASDMAGGFLKAVREFLPEARLVLDRFHVVKLFNEKLTKLRRDLYREATDDLHKAVLKGTRWLLLKNPENLDDDRNEHQRLQDALSLNAPLATAYYLKEDLRQFWEQATKPQAERWLTAWCRRAEQTGIKVLQQMTRTLQKHRTSLLAWYDDPISTGPLEGVNNKLKLLQRQAFGYRDLELFKLRILSLHTTHKTLVG
jgi:transposase